MVPSILGFLFSAVTKQLEERFCPFNPSVRQSICGTFFTMFLSSYHKFSGVITIYRNDIHAEGQGQKSRVKVTELKQIFVPI